MPEKDIVLGQDHTKLTLRLAMALAGLVFAMGFTYSEIASLKDQTAKQWQKLSKIEGNTTQLAIMNGKIDTIMNLLQDK